MKYVDYSDLQEWLRSCQTLGITGAVARHTDEIRPQQVNLEHDVAVCRSHTVWLGAYSQGVIHQLRLTDPPADLRQTLEQHLSKLRWVRDHIS